MNNEQEWIDWHPKAGDFRPQVYRWKLPADEDWEQGLCCGARVSRVEIVQGQQFQIPAPKPTEDRPPWIDPQCKFRWGDRVKDKHGNIWFVNHPHDGDGNFPVVCTKTRNYATPYEATYVTNWHIDDNIEVFNEEDIELCPEDLPQHFDDRLLDADGPHKSEKVPCEVWVNEYPTLFGRAFTSYDTAKEEGGEGSIRIVHFREVL
jgi:hypothetical protein